MAALQKLCCKPEFSSVSVPESTKRKVKFNITDDEVHPEITGVRVVPMARTPMDYFKFQYRCSPWIRNQTATAIISVISLTWAAAELIAASKFIARIFPLKGDDYFYSKAVYMVLAGGLAFASVVLMIALYVNNYLLVTGYVWYALIFVVVYVVTTTAGLVVSFVNKTMGRRLAMRIVAAVAWNCLFVYFLMIVNSYRIMLWVCYG